MLLAKPRSPTRQTISDIGSSSQTAQGNAQSKGIFGAASSSADRCASRSWQGQLLFRMKKDRLWRRRRRIGTEDPPKRRQNGVSVWTKNGPLGPVEFAPRGGEPQVCGCGLRCVGWGPSSSKQVESVEQEKTTVRVSGEDIEKSMFLDDHLVPAPPTGHQLKPVFGPFPALHFGDLLGSVLRIIRPV